MRILCGVFRHMGRGTAGYNQKLIMRSERFCQVTGYPNRSVQFNSAKMYFSRSLPKISRTAPFREGIVAKYSGDGPAAAVGGGSSLRRLIRAARPRPGDGQLTGERHHNAACPVNHNFPICRRAPPLCEFATMLPRSPRPRAADDFATIRARMEELRRERARAPTDVDARTSDGPRPYAVSSRPALADRPGLSPAIRRALLKVRTA